MFRRKPCRHPQNRPIAVESLETRQLLSSTTTTTVSPNLILTPAASGSSFTGYTPAQIKAAYGFTSISGNGAGQTIAIVDAFDDPNIQADLNAFDAKYGLANTTITKMSQTGGSTKSVKADAGWSGEIALDVEWAHAIAPGAKILLVEANSDSLTDLMAGVDVARRASGVSVVSMSWGGGEFSGQSYFDKYFTTPSGHQGVTFVAASGDEGGWYGPEWPATSPNVLAVGGTTLNLTSTGTYSGETAWTGSTGGISQVVSEPTYQRTAQTTGVRTSPDVSYDANPNTGFSVYDSYSGGWTVVGGTSAGAPQWAALIALADQARVAAGKSTLDGASGTLPALYKLYASPSSASYATYTADFHDVATGRTSAFTSAVAGYDVATGLGSPKASAVVSALSSATTTSTTTGTTSTSSSRGHRHTIAAVAKADVVATTAATTETAAEVAASVPPTGRFALALGPNAAPQVYETLLSVPDRASGSAATTGASAGTATSTGATSSGGAGGTTASAAPTIAMATTTIEALPASTVVPPAALAVPNVFAATTPIVLSTLDAAATFGDSLANFVHDSAESLLPIADVPQLAGPTVVPWVATAGVLAADAVLVGRWVANRRRERREAESQARSTFSLAAVSPDGSEMQRLYRL